MKTVTNFLKISALLTTVWLTGCRSGTIADPNEPPANQQVSGEILLRNIGEMMSALDQRINRQEVRAEDREKILNREIGKLLAKIDVNQIPPKQSWQFGDAYRLAGDWKTAKTLYEKAVASAVTVDRKVNDNLRLARAQAHLGDVSASIATARSTFSVGPKEKAPILLAVLYEIVPEAVGKDNDKELAKLLAEAIEQHKQTIVDPTSDAGKNFLLARPAHIHNAWIRIARLYQDLGMQKEARDAILKDEADRQTTGNF